MANPNNPFAPNDPRYQIWESEPGQRNKLVPRNIYQNEGMDLTPMDNINAPVSIGQPGQQDPSLGAVPVNTNNPYAPPSPNMVDRVFPQGIGLKDIYDVGRLGVGLSGALEKTPEYEKPANWNSYMGRMNQLSQEGFTPEEYGQARTNAERGYNYDIHNLTNMAGGNASVYLGNAGRAADTLYGHLGNLATQDAAMRRSNLQQYGNALGQDVAMGRRIYEDHLNNIVRNKQSGAALANDAIYNLNNRGDFNKQYGTGSKYDQMMDLQLKNMQGSNDMNDMQKAYMAENMNKPAVTPAQNIYTTPQFPNSPSFGADPQQNPYFPNLPQ